MKLKVRKCPTDDLAVSNCAIVNANTLDSKNIKHILLKTGPAHHFIFTIRNHSSLRSEEIAFAMPQRKWASLSLDQEVDVQPYTFANAEFIDCVTFSADFHSKKKFIYINEIFP